MLSNGIPPIDEKVDSPTIQYFIAKIDNNYSQLKDYKAKALQYTYGQIEPKNPADCYFLQLRSMSTSYNSSYVKANILDSLEKEAIAYVKNLGKCKNNSEELTPQPALSPSSSVINNSSSFWNKNACRTVGVALMGVVISTALYSMSNR